LLKSIIEGKDLGIGIRRRYFNSTNNCQICGLKF
jgi:hypothetical protein